MEGFDGLDPGRNLEIVPTLVGGVTEERADFPAGELDGGGLEAEPGITVRWGFTPNLSLNATLNPDFSQVEADVAQLEINNQFALFFPEKRPFFLEGADFFDTRFDTVFTRNVLDPSWGVKLTGKAGANGLGVFLAEDEVTSLVFPGSQGSDGDTFDFETTDAALRYRRDFGRSSAIGAVFTGRQGGDYSSYLGGVDGLYRLGESDSINFQLIASETEYPADVAADFEQPAGTLSDSAFRFEYDRSARNWGAWFDYIDVGEDFRADLGFMPRVDYRQVIGGLRHRWWGDTDDWYNSWAIGGDYDITEDQTGLELERELELWWELSGPMQSYVFVDAGTRDRHFDGVDFDDQRFIFSYAEFQPTGDLYLELEWEAVEAIDFDNTRPGDQLTISPEVRYNLGDHVRISLEHTLSRLDVEGGRLFEANLSQMR
ncbi:MAG: DUF5916 domain-containing protein, partial [Thermoanaerobaculia bacterium]|nr:DUF5916 domain-containing protein [Thermoanaerobaculia bacterium]